MSLRSEGDGPSSQDDSTGRLDGAQAIRKSKPAVPVARGRNANGGSQDQKGWMRGGVRRDSIAPFINAGQSRQAGVKHDEENENVWQQPKNGSYKVNETRRLAVVTEDGHTRRDRTQVKADASSASKGTSKQAKAESEFEQDAEEGSEKNSEFWDPGWDSVKDLDRDIIFGDVAQEPELDQDSHLVEAVLESQEGNSQRLEALELSLTTINSVGSQPLGPPPSVREMRIPCNGSWLQVPSFKSVASVALTAMAAAGAFEHATVELLIQALRKLRGTSLRAWRRDFDKCSVGWVSQPEFCKACRFYGCPSDSTWMCLSAHRSGSAHLRFWELDHEEAQNLELFETVLWIRTGFDLDKAWHILDPSNKQVITMQDFARGCKLLGFSGNSTIVFRGLDAFGIGRVARTDFEYLKKLSPLAGQLENFTPELRLLRRWTMEVYADVAELLARLRLVCNFSGGWAQNYENLEIAEFARRLKALGYPGDAETVAVQVADCQVKEPGQIDDCNFMSDSIAAANVCLALFGRYRIPGSRRRERSPGSPPGSPAFSGGSPHAHGFTGLPVGLGGSPRSLRSLSPPGSPGRPAVAGSRVAAKHKKADWDNSTSGNLGNSERPPSLRCYFSSPRRDERSRVVKAASQPTLQQSRPLSEWKFEARAETPPADELPGSPIRVRPGELPPRP
eukprot:TRINITY_DN103879_c0_g1_i1.p1 TRINITY_DN103879_c0_g1~~TRINITY_DN103879_c0_g1_i1.p1  ORF type:complete len:750 (-),score=131.43 TRINITY_DN103879_c0_g1_i1:85-2115(-)